MSDVRHADPARREAMRTYAQAHDQFVRLEDQMRRDGFEVMAEGAHQYGRIVLRAWLAEKEDRAPEP